MIFDVLLLYDELNWLLTIYREWNELQWVPMKHDELRNVNKICDDLDGWWWYWLMIVDDYRWLIYTDDGDGDSQLLWAIICDGGLINSSMVW